MSIEKEIWMKERFKENKNEKKKKEKRVRFWQRHSLVTPPRSA
jgi:ribosomal protein S19